MDESVAISCTSMAETITLLQQTSLPDELASLDGGVQVARGGPGSVSKEKGVHNSWCSVAPVHQAIFVIS